MKYIELTKSKLNEKYNDMKLRCTNTYWKNHEWYKNTKMCDEWKYNMYSFYDWVNDGQFYTIEGEKSVHLDKDILGRVTGKEKLYSPETCLFVPASINTFFGGTSGNTNGVPIGVEKIPDTNKYKVSNKAFKINDIFDTPEKAWECWREHKEAQKIAIADKYYNQNLIPKKVYDAIMRYEFRITD